ncbi:hypothetical protein EDB19DRAFT_1652204, partial [Suillus lakei]
RVARLRLIFKLPNTVYGAIDAPTYWPKEPLAYVEWYAPLAHSVDEDHKMYQVKKAAVRRGGSPPGEIVFLSSICQSCQLIPCFGSAKVPIAWTSETVLDCCSKFWLNNWSSKYVYQSIW